MFTDSNNINNSINILSPKNEILSKSTVKNLIFFLEILLKIEKLKILLIYYFFEIKLNMI